MAGPRIQLPNSGDDHDNTDDDNDAGDSDDNGAGGRGDGGGSGDKYAAANDNGAGDDGDDSRRFLHLRANCLKPVFVFFFFSRATRKRLFRSSI